MTKRIAIFVDGSNFSASCNVVGLRPDYDKIVSMFAKEGHITGQYYFTALPPKEVDTPLRKVTDRLQYHGWRLVTKETKTLVDGDRTFIKGDMDADMIVWAFKVVEYIDELILFSGDGDFRSMVEELQIRSVKVTAVSVLRPDNKSMMADELRRQVDRFIDLETIKGQIDMMSSNKPQATGKFLRGRLT
jgi:uncharacterized LabA/DUF88 family protein